MKLKKRGSFFNLIGVILIFVLIVAFPLITVWKQAYITNSSMRQEVLADSIAVLKQEAALLKMEVEHLSSIERIECIAMEELGLKYPKSSNIIIIKNEKNSKDRYFLRWNFFTMLKKSLFQEKG